MTTTRPVSPKAIVLSTWAGEKGGLGALGLVRMLAGTQKKAIEIDDQALADEGRRHEVRDRLDKLVTSR